MLKQYALATVLLWVSLLVSCSAAPPPAGQQQHWQNTVLCRDADRRLHVCPPSSYQALLDKHAAALATSSSWPVLISAVDGSTPRKGHAVATSSNSATAQFLVLARLLQPSEANIAFAQAFCVSIGGRLAYWNSPQEFAALQGTVKAAATELGTLKDMHVLVGAVQLPGMQRADAGWVWLHKPYQVPKSGFPWAPGEPNDHNKKQSHTEDCAALGTHSGNVLVDDFPCNYATPEGTKFQFNGHNPHLTVACRV